MNKERSIHTNKKVSLKEEFLNILQRKQLTIHFQPIVNFQRNRIEGYEALSRGPVNSTFYNPSLLFPYAENLGLLPSLEKIARECAFKESSGLSNDKKLFINVNSDVIHEKGFNLKNTLFVLQKYGIEANNVVFEITERNKIHDFAALRDALNHFREQGFKIAIDDAGAGYSSLQAISELMPEYIKVDRSLISGIDRNEVKASILEAFVTFSKKINCVVIAEGIETEAECHRLIELGIEYGQGYFLAKPSNPIPVLSNMFKQSIDLYNVEHKNRPVPKDLSDHFIFSSTALHL